MSFARALSAAGLLPGDVIADGKWHRCATVDKPKKKNGAYLLTIDGQRGFFKNFATDINFNVWRQARPLSVTEKRSFVAQARALAAKERTQRIKAVQAMRAHWLALPPLRFGHPYLEGKSLSLHGCEGLRLDGDKLVIPMMNGSQLQSLQSITPAGAKTYRAGCRVTGATYTISRPNATLTCFTEGFATGLAIFQSVADARVIVCFDAVNLLRVAESAKPAGLTVVCADNDWYGPTNTGLEKGLKAAELMRCGVSYPKDIRGSDWADALKEWGSPARVKLEIMRGARFVAAP